MLNISGCGVGIALRDSDEGGESSPAGEGDDDPSSRTFVPVRETRETAGEGAA
jgi:hypothetical protein